MVMIIVAVLLSRLGGCLIFLIYCVFKVPLIKEVAVVFVMTVEDTNNLGDAKRTTISACEESAGKRLKITSLDTEDLDNLQCSKTHALNFEANTKQESEESHIGKDILSSNLGTLGQGMDRVFLIEAGAAEDKGSRHSMEDAFVVLPDASMESPGTLRCLLFS